MTALRTPEIVRARRAAGFVALLGTAVAVVSAKAVSTPPPHRIILGIGTGSGTGSGATSGGGARSGSSHAGAGSSAGSASASTARRSILGPAVDVSYGYVQVRVTLAGSRIVDVTPVQLPRGGRSSDIASYAAPQLRSEVLAAQSTSIDSISGASYTSQGYAESVQAALDAARRAS